MFAHSIRFWSCRVRYAPSPTGNMHLGGLRTAFYNHLYARRQGGKLILRIEDTDQSRNVAGSYENILDTLKWANIVIDEGPSVGGPHQPYIQSKRLHHYKAVWQQLIQQQKAYPCFCEAKSNHKENVEKYNGNCRKLTLADISSKIKSGQKFAIRIKSDILTISPSFDDQVYGIVGTTPFDDFVIVKRDGMPTFHLANVVDDIAMKISHIIRGQEWLTNTSKHIYLYQVLGARPPKFCHIPLIVGPTGKKLAKRDPFSSLSVLKGMDIEDEALANYLFRLGCSPKPSTDEEFGIRSLDSLIKAFQFQSMSKSPIQYDSQLVSSLNRRAILKKWQDPKQSLKMIERIKIYIPESSKQPNERIIAFWNSIGDRVRMMPDVKKYDYYFKAPTFDAPQTIRDFNELYGKSATLSLAGQITPTDAQPQLYSTNQKILQNIILILTHVIPDNQFSETAFAMRISQYLSTNGRIKNQTVFHLLRFVLTSKRSGPSVTQLCSFLGKQQIVARIKIALKMNV